MPIYTIANSLGEINWASLLPGDEVRIPWRSTPYSEKILMRARGTAASRIRVVGILGPAGQKPVIDAFNATTHSQFAFSPTYRPIEDAGLFTFNRYASDPSTHRPGFVTLENIQFRNAGWHNPTKNYTAFDGTGREYSHDASGIYIVCGDSIEVKNCEIDRNGNGVFVLGSQRCTDFALRGSYIHDNGWTQAGLPNAHNVYVESLGAIYEDNRFGRPAVAGVVNLKDRSAGTIVRRNRIEGSARCIDLSVAQDLAPDAILRDDYYRQIIENNLLILTSDPRDGTQFVYCEGRTDSQGRAQTVDFNFNTMACNRPPISDQNSCTVAYSWEGHPGTWPKVNADHNLAWANGAGGAWSPWFTLFRQEGTAALLPNVFPAGWGTHTAGDGSQVFVTGQANLIIAGTSDANGRSMPDPFVDSPNGNYTLPVGSPYAGFGCNLTAPPPPPGPDEWELIDELLFAGGNYKLGLFRKV
mgnify:CR=1 FL=1